MNVIQELAVPASQLRVRPGHNPRRHFDPVAIERLANLIRARGGIIQSVVIRKISDLPEFAIIAGERRWRAAQTIDPDYSIPCRLVEADDQEALAIALTENDGREDLSPTEEAASAKKYLDMCKGNREEAAAYLGWPLTKLVHRLALLQCTENVRDALTHKRLLLGHAELLARLAPKNQEIALARIIDNDLSVAVVKAKLADLSQKLTSAIFDIGDCKGCPHNTSEQSGLFAEALAEGHCTNPACFTEKSNAALNTKRDQLLQEVPMVAFVEPGNNVVPIKLIADGPTGVGVEQANACRSCANFGCTISKLPAALGQVEHSICFDAACNSRKVADRIKREELTDEKSDGVKSAPKQAVAGKTAASVAAPSTTPQRVSEYRVAQWRKITANIIAANPDVGTKVLLSLGLAGHSRCVSQDKFGEVFKKIAGRGVAGTTMTHVLQRVDEATADHYPKLLAVMAATAVAELDKTVLTQLMQYLKVDIGAYWQINSEFCELLTKSELESMADEVGLKSAIGEPFAKVVSSKKSDVIKRLLSVNDFEYRGKVPAVMQYDGDRSAR